MYIGAGKVFCMRKVLSKADRRSLTESLFYIHRGEKFEKNLVESGIFQILLEIQAKLKNCLCTRKKQKNTKKKCFFAEISNCSKIFSRKDINTFDI